MAQTVIGIFDSASEAQAAVEALINQGFNRDTIDLSTNTTAEGTTSTTTNRMDDRDDNDSGGGIGGFFRSLFGGDDDDDRTTRYAEVGSRGSIVTVHASSDDEAERAADLLDEYGAVDVDERSESYRSETTMGTTGTGTTQPLMNQVQDFTQEGDQTIQVMEENLQVDKRIVETGGVRLRSRIVERPVEENLRLREERVHVQRTPVNRAVTDADLAGFKDGEIELTEHAEVAVVSKEARVVEEVTLGKEVQEREETIRDTVRRTDVEVEQLGSTESERYRTDKQTGTTNRAATSDDL